MATYRKILVGVDLHQGDRVAANELSAESQAAIDEAVVMAVHSGATVTLCAALDVSAQTATLIQQDHQNLLKTVEDIASERMDQIVAQMQGRGVTCDKLVRLGTPEEQLSRVVVEGGYDLLVVGTRSRSKASRALFGSTAQKLMRAAACAVWVVKPAAVREIREIAVAVDLSDAGRPALAEAVEVARGLSAKLFVVHSLDLKEVSYLLMAGISMEEITAARTRMIDEAYATLQQHLAATDYRTLPYGVKVEVIEGAADDIIPTFVSDNQIDILVMGTHGRSGLSRLVLGNTAERILPMVDCSVIAVKPHDFISPYA